MSEIEKKIKEIVKSLGADVCGIGNIDRFVNAPSGFSPIDIFPNCKSVIAFGVALPKGIFKVDPKLIYAHFNGDVICRNVDDIAFKASVKIENELKILAIPMPCDAPNDYWEVDTMTAKGMISMKHTAIACGLGQLGKSTLLINPTYGNRLTIGAILTDANLESDVLCENICIEGCNKCVKSCPVGAIQNRNVVQGLCRPNTYGQTARGFGTVECNTCRNVCPVKNGK